MLKENKTKICKICGMEFDTNYPNKVYCSSGCQKRSRNRYLKVSNEPIIKVCEICGEEYRLPHIKGNRKYCSQTCAKEAIRLRKRAKSVRTKRYMDLCTCAVEARKKGKTYGQFTKLDVRVVFPSWVVPMKMKK